MAILEGWLFAALMLEEETILVVFSGFEETIRYQYGEDVASRIFNEEIEFG